MEKYKSLKLIEGDIFSNTDKLLIYKGALNLLFRFDDFSICSIIIMRMRDMFNIPTSTEVDINYFLEKHKLSPIHYPNKYAELFKYKPDNIDHYGYWFPLTHRGNVKRILIVKNIIADLELNIKTQTHDKT